MLTHTLLLADTTLLSAPLAAPLACCSTNAHMPTAAASVFQRCCPVCDLHTAGLRCMAHPAALRCSFMSWRLVRRRSRARCAAHLPRQLMTVQALQPRLLKGFCARITRRLLMSACHLTPRALTMCGLRHVTMAARQLRCGCAGNSSNRCFDLNNSLNNTKHTHRHTHCLSLMNTHAVCVGGGVGCHRRAELPLVSNRYLHSSNII